MKRGRSAGWIRRLWGYMLHHRRDLVLAMVAAVLGSALQTLVPLIARRIVDDVIGSQSALLWPWLVLLVVLAVVTFWLAYIRRYHGGRVALYVQYELRNEMHDHLQSMDLHNLGKMPTGQLVARANSDSTLVQGLLAFFPLMSGNVLRIALSLVVMLYLSPPLAVVSFLVVPVVAMTSYRMRWRVFPASWDGQQREGDVAQIVDEGVNGVRVVKAFAQERRELERVVETSKRLYGSQMRAVRLQSRYQPLLETIPALAQVGILALGGWMALHGQITLGTFLAFSAYVAQFVPPARQLAGLLTIGQQARAGLERIFQLLDLPPAIADPPDAVELGTLRGEVVFDDVSFGYRDEDHVLRGFDLHIRAGERVALVGASGSGKSTVAALVGRFHDPDRGRVYIDGHDARTVRLASLRRQLGYAFEEAFLFSDTVRANIAYARPDASDDEVREAARRAHADGFIEELPQGWDTPVGERGLTLSGGQRQRIALARAILAEPRILVLDDATSAVDAVIEMAIHDALRDVLAGRTTILIAHRRSTLHLADRIVVLEAGRVVDMGTHDELTARSAAYRSLLTGLDEEYTEQLAGRIEALAATTNGTTESAWQRSHRPRPERGRGVQVSGNAAMGPGLGGGGGGWRLNLAPTPELVARVAALPPVRDFPTVDVEEESRPDPAFSLPRLLKQFRRPLTAGLVLVVLDALATLAGPVLVRNGVDEGVQAGSEAALFTASAVFLVITLADLVNLVGETFITGRTAQRIMLSLRVRIWAQLQRLSLDYYERELAGRIMTRMTTDVDQFETLIENGLLSALVSGVTFVGVGVALLVMDLPLGLCTLTVIVPLAAATVLFRRRAAHLYSTARERIAIVNADFQESLSGVRESQAFCHEELTRHRFHRLGADYLESRVAAQRLVAVYFPFVQFLAAIADAIVLGVGAHLIGAGELTTGVLIAFLLYLDMFFSPIQQLSQVFDSWQQTRVSVARIAELMRLTTLTPNPADPDDPGPLDGRIRLDDVHFSYPVDDQPARFRIGPADVRLASLSASAAKPPEALRGIDLRVEPGDTLALVGQTGAGKSTVMKLVARFYDPDDGAVTVDGHDLRRLDLADFRRLLGYVPQEAFLFSGTVRDNIAYGRPGASDAEVEAAARAVGAHELIATLPGGYLHELLERGKSLSSGQRQLITLARAELVDPVVLLLDEATSNLDLATEHRVVAAMQRVARRRTTVIIAHRLPTARSADRIAVLHEGEVVEAGTHEELLDAEGRYAAMWESFDLARAESSTL